MSTMATMQTHIAYELADCHDADVMVIEFRCDELAGTNDARDLRDELDALVGPDWPHRFVIDFANAHSLDREAFGEIVAFARQVGRLVVCNLGGKLRLEAAMADLDLHAAFAPDRQSAVEEARGGEMRGQDETVDYPVFEPERDEGADQKAASEPGQSDGSASSKIVVAARAADRRPQVRDQVNDKERPARPAERAVAIAAGLTIEDFGGRSDAPGG